MKKRLALALLAVATITGCGAPLAPVSAPPTNMAVVSDVGVTRNGGISPVAVRTYTTVNGNRVEVSGARCEVRSKQMRGSLVTPQVVNIPNYSQSDALAARGKPENLQVTCRYNGKVGAALIPSARNQAEALAIVKPSQVTTTQGPVNNGGVASEIGLYIGNSIASGIHNSLPWKFFYYPITVDLK